MSVENRLSSPPGWLDLSFLFYHIHSKRAYCLHLKSCCAQNKPLFMFHLFFFFFYQSVSLISQAKHFLLCNFFFVLHFFQHVKPPSLNVHRTRSLLYFICKFFRYFLLLHFKVRFLYQTIHISYSLNMDFVQRENVSLPNLVCTFFCLTPRD